MIHISVQQSVSTDWSSGNRPVPMIFFGFSGILLQFFGTLFDSSVFYGNLQDFMDFFWVLGFLGVCILLNSFGFFGTLLGYMAKCRTNSTLLVPKSICWNNQWKGDFCDAKQARKTSKSPGALSLKKVWAGYALGRKSLGQKYFDWFSCWIG